MSTQYFCGNENRRDAVRFAKGGGGKPILNGMDYLEVASADQKTLEIHFIHPLPGDADAVPPAPAPQLSEDNFAIEGGVRTKGIKILKAVTSGNVVTLTVDVEGDFSAYKLHLVSGEASDQPPSGFDPQLATLVFSFKVECPSDFDCAPANECPPEALSAPVIDYLARDFSSFRQLMLDRMSTIMPGWTERHTADLGIALVEAVAYSADQLSYYQDAVATETYLGTARQRVSLRRHARLLDYQMHDGCNARAWVCFEVDESTPADGFELTAGTILLTRGLDDAIVFDPASLAQVLQAETPVIFETLHNITLHHAHNSIQFYTWDDSECYLPAGATRATLLNTSALKLKAGEVLIFEEVLSPVTGFAADADPAHRHAVRMTKVISKLEDGISALTDPLHGTPIVEIEWDAADALPFPVCISAMVTSDTGTHLVTDMSVARGNVVLADHGLTISGEEIGEITPDTAGNLPRPMLKNPLVTRQGRTRDRFGELVRDVQNETMVFDPNAPASTAQAWEMRDTLPAVKLIENSDNSRPWLARQDLLTSNRFDHHFTVETDNDGSAFIRFGDGFHAEMPKPASTFTATYRIGNGAAGNVGEESIARVLMTNPGVVRVRNPIAAWGGAEAESLEEVRQYAPQAFRIQERAVTTDDYARMAERHPEVQKAAATLRWTGSWYTVFITVDRKNGREVDADFEAEMRAFMEKYRLAGQDMEIVAPRFVPLDIIFTVCVKPGYFRAHVKEELLKIFSNKKLPDGTFGFFHPDNFTFGQTLYLSQLVARMMEVPGVKWVDGEDVPAKPNRFRRWGEAANGEFAAGKIAFGRLEIARLDNDPSLPENGRIDLVMEGGM